MTPGDAGVPRESLAGAFAPKASAPPSVPPVKSLAGLVPPIARTSEPAAPTPEVEAPPPPKRAPSRKRESKKAADKSVLEKSGVWVPVSIKQTLDDARASRRQTVTQIVLAAIQAHHDEIKTAALRSDTGGGADGLFVQQASPRRRDLVEPLTQITLLLVAANQEAIDRLAGEAGMNRSSFVTEALRRHLPQA